MSTTIAPPPVTGDDRAVISAPPTQPEPVRQRRRPVVLGLGVALIALGVLAGAWYGSQTNQAAEVLILQTDLDAGEVLTLSDLRSSPVASGDDIATIAVADADQYTGLTLIGNLPADTVLTPAMFAERVQVSDSRELVGIAFTPRQIPFTGVRPGDQVTVVVAVGPEGSVGQAQGTDPELAVLTTPGQTWSAEVAAVSNTIQDDGSITIDLAISGTDATQVAAAGGSGDLVLVLTPNGQD